MDPQILNIIKIDPLGGVNLIKFDHVKINALVSRVSNSPATPIARK